MTTTDAALAPLSPTPRTTVGRGRKRLVEDRAALHDLLDDALVAHLGVVTGDHPVVLPVAFGIDLDGPDEGGTLYVHGSVAARWLGAADGRPVCVTVTELDGLVTARSAFHHSMNYRSAVIIGAARVVTDAAERARALDLVVDHMIPGRSATLRASTRKELAATAVLAVPLHEASMKARAGGAVDEPEDVAGGGWAGHIPLRRVAGAPVPDADAVGPTPVVVEQRARRLTVDAALRRPAQRVPAGAAGQVIGEVVG
ncbi:pyridoxamine 5'-phosphate oxidase family protein [Xylanimonas protaetiae]|uniref:Pyridoxamine 5'-phosphate oxidase family protein n=1 Tax=Xylanimonas protaetiae TaxID=2509457 RepID=A0A4P6F149_9MICO|nr:pyridoxamine 5'-phosphate oxidase family protein [Xylanimonas protaetiae]QAY69202.1 pyridoxamine 5'-phosphate oxidase family protein [Xylanimonas protaetiae]